MARLGLARWGWHGRAWVLIKASSHDSPGETDLVKQNMFLTEFLFVEIIRKSTIGDLRGEGPQAKVMLHSFLGL